MANLPKDAAGERSEPPVEGAISRETAPNAEHSVDDTEEKPAPPGTPPLGEYDSANGSGKTGAQAALEVAKTELDTSQAASERAEAKLETAQAELDTPTTENVEPPATGRRPASPFYSPDEWRLLLWTFGIGFLGGGFAQVLGFDSARGAPFYITMLSGGMAAVIAVFFLARTDTDKRIHLTLFALLCGFIGSPLVKEAVSSFGKGFGIQGAALQSLQKSNQLAEELETKVATPEGRAEAAKTLQTIEKNVQAAIETTAAGDESVKSAVAANVENTVNTLQQIAPSAPTETLRTVENIGVSAAVNGQQKVAEHALAAARELSTHESAGTRKAAAATVTGLNRLLNIKPRVHLEVASDLDMSSLRLLKGRLGETGYELVGPERTSVPEGAAKVIYYDAADEEEAKWIATKLGEAGVLNVKTEKREKPAGFRPRHFDVQLGAGSLSPPS